MVRNTLSKRMFILFLVFIIFISSTISVFSMSYSYMKINKPSGYLSSLKESMEELEEIIPETDIFVVDMVIKLFYYLPLVLGESLNWFLKIWGMTPDAIIYGNSTPDNEKTEEMKTLKEKSMDFLNPNIIENKTLKQIFFEIGGVLFYSAGGVYIIAFLVNILMSIISFSMLIKYRARENFKKWLLSFILFFSIFPLLYFAIRLDNSIVQIFKAQGGIMDAFEEAKTKSWIGLINYLVINLEGVWLFILYSLRSLYLLFINILVFVALFKLSFGKEDTLSILTKEYIGNVFINSIHAFIFAGVAKIIVLDINPIIQFIAVAVIIPATVLLQSWLGLKSYGGSLKNAVMGTGMIVGAIAIGREVFGNYKRGFNDIKDGAGELSAVNKEYALEDKGYGISNEDRASKQRDDIPSYSPSYTGAYANSNTTETSRNNLEREHRRRVARNRIAKGVSGLTLGTASATTGAATGFALGSYKGAFLGGSIGSELGDDTGRSIGSTVEHGVEGSAWLLNKRENEDFIGKKFGLDSEIFEGTEYAEKMKNAYVSQEMWQAFGMESLAENSYIKNLPEQKKMSDVLNGGDTFFEYQDNNNRVFFTADMDKETGELKKKDIIKVELGNGNPNLESSIIRGWQMSEDGQEIKASIPSSVLKTNMEIGRMKADKIYNIKDAEEQHKKHVEQYIESNSIEKIRDSIAANISFEEQEGLADSTNAATIDYQISEVDYDNLKKQITNYSNDKFDTNNKLLASDMKNIAVRVNEKLNLEVEGYTDLNSSERKDMFMNQFNEEVDTYIVDNIENIKLDKNITRKIQQQANIEADDVVNVKQLKIDRAKVADNITRQLNNQYVKDMESLKSIETNNAYYQGSIKGPQMINSEQIETMLKDLNSSFEKQISTSIDYI